jgi:hypothetical protein
MEQDELPQGVVSKICLNIAGIQTELGHHKEAVIMHVKSIQSKRDEQPLKAEELRD